MNSNKSSEADARNARLWKSRGRGVCRRVNFGWWLSFFVPTCLALSVIFLCFILSAKRLGWTLTPIWSAFAGGLALAGLLVLFIVKRRFIVLAEGLARLEAQMRLHNQLSVANVGFTSWPESTKTVEAPVRWRWNRLVSAAVLQLALILAALFLPVRRAEQNAIATSIEPPVSLGQVEAWVEELREEQLIAPEALERFEEQQNELLTQPKEEWYDHSSLEAGEALREKMESAIDSLTQGLAQAGSALEELEERSAHLSAEEREALQSQLGEALSDLQSNSLPLQAELINPLTEFAEKGLENFSKSELEELRKGIAKNQAKLQDLKKSRTGKGTEQKQEAGANGKQSTEGKQSSKGEKQASGNCENGSSTDGGMCEMEPNKSGDGEGEAGGRSAGERENGTGKEQPGGISRGPGEAPLSLEEKSPQLTSGRVENIPGSEGLADDEVGEMVGLRPKIPDVNGDAVDRGSGLEAASGVRGGAAALEGRFVPEEQAIVKKYFE